MHCSALPKTCCFACMFLAALTCPSRAEIVLGLIGGPQFAVEQAFPHSPTEVHPIDGESLIVWALLTNNGPEVFEATGPGGTESPSSGTTALWRETPYYLWDPLADPDDPLVVTLGVDDPLPLPLRSVDDSAH